MKKNIFTFGLLFFVFSISNVQAEEQKMSPEEKCFQHLSQTIDKGEIFPNINLKAVTKINDWDGEVVESQQFSLDTYGGFKSIAETPIPGFGQDIYYFPNGIEKTAPQYLITPEIHKANRNGTTGIVKYKNNTETSIGNVDDDPQEEIIKGYFLDTQYATFGRKSDLKFSFPSRDRNTDPAYDYPTGPPYKDIREYVLFASHLNPDHGGDLLSCGLVLVEPQGDYVLTAQDNTQKSITWENYGHDKQGTLNIATELVGDDFRRVNADFLVAAKEKNAEGGGFNYDNDLVKFTLLFFTYDNDSDFMNEFETIEVFSEILNDPENKDLSFHKLYKKFYQTLIDRFDFGVMGEGETGKDGEAFFYDGVEFSTIEKIGTIEDKTLRDMIHSSIVPGYADRFLHIPHEDDLKNDFEKAYVEYPLNYQERLENVEHLIENSGNLANLSPDELEYKDIIYGEAVIPIADKRIRDIVSQDYLTEEFEQIEADKDAQLEAITITDDMSIPEQQEAYMKQNKIEREFEADLTTLMALEDEFKKFKVDFADIENKFEHQRINESEYEAERKALLNDFNNLVKTGKLADNISAERIDKLSQSLTSHYDKIDHNQRLNSNPESEITENTAQVVIFKVVALILFVLAIIFALLATKTKKKIY